MNNVIKRDGQEVEFDKSKIVNAVSKAMARTEKGIDLEVANLVANKTEKKIEKSKNEIHIESIQDMVEEYLMQSNRKDVAQEYIRYRFKRNEERNSMSYIDKEIQGLFDLTSEEIVNNANKAGDKLHTYRAMIADITSKDYAKRNIVPKWLNEAHEEGSIYLHDYNYVALPVYNCQLINWIDMLENGFEVGSTKITSPKGITTAIALLSQIVAHVSSNCYGGVSLPSLCTGLEPYARKSYEKHYTVGLKWLKDENKAKEYAWERLEKEVYDAAQAFEYEISTLTNSRGETPFLTIEFGLGQGDFCKLIQKSFLKVRLKGFENDVSPVFPKIIFTLKKGLNLNPEDENYDVFQLAVQCSSKRLYPDYINYDRVVEVTGSHKASMGCVAGDELITYKYQGNIFVESFRVMWNKFASNFQAKLHGISEYIEVDDLFIRDKDNTYTKVKKIIKNPNQNNWKLVRMDNGRSLTATADHPLPTSRGRLFVKDMRVGDSVPVYKDSYQGDLDIYEDDFAWMLGVMICDSSYVSTIRISIANEGEDEIEENIYNVFNKYYAHDIKTINQERGKKGVYKDIVIGGEGIGKTCALFAEMFKSFKKDQREIPSIIFESCVSTRLNFMAGMIDADGYVHKKGRVQIGSTNKTLALQQLELAQSLGIHAKMYLNKYSSSSDKYRYRIEFPISKELLNCIKCKKKQDNIEQYTSIVLKDRATVKEIIDLPDFNQESYDVETESDTFYVSGLLSHNCRSFLPSYKDEDGNEKTLGRFNTGVVSISLPRLALKANGNEEEFFNLLDKYLEMTKDALLFRRSLLKGVKAKQAPILYQNGATARLQPEETIDNLLENSYSTASIGYVGLYNCMNALYGESFVDSEQMLQKGIKIMQYMKDYADKMRKETGIGFSIYGSPAENLATRFCKKDIEDFGLIEGVTDQGYYENSFHVPATYEISPFEKIDIESNFSKLSTGGAIQYVQFGSMIHNTKALETIIRYAYDKTHYFGVNVASDACFTCGYRGEITPQTIDRNDYKCPQCGNEDKNNLSIIRRVSGYLGSFSERPTVDNKMKEIHSRVKHYKGSK